MAAPERAGLAKTLPPRMEPLEPRLLLSGPFLSIDDVQVVEGNSGTTNSVFTVSLSASSDSTITVDYSTADGTAEGRNAPIPYGSAGSGQFKLLGLKSNTLVLVDPATGGLTTLGQDSNLPYVAGMDFAPDGSLYGAFSSLYRVDSSTGATTLIAEMPEWVTGLTFSPSGELYVSSAWGNRIYKIDPDTGAELDSHPITGTVHADGSAWSTEINSIEFGPDGTLYAVGAGLYTLNTATGAATRITPMGQDIFPSENMGELDFGNDGALRSVTLITSEELYSINPSTGLGSLAATMSAKVKSLASIELTTSGDYDWAVGRLTFTPGQTSKTITVRVIGDTQDEGHETFTVNLSGASNATISDGQGVGTILNDDAPPTLSIGDAQAYEGGDAVFTVTLSSVSGSTVTVDYTTADGTAAAPDDYAAVSGTLTFLPGLASRTITVHAYTDMVTEGDETFTVTLSAPTNATIADGTGDGTILNVLPPTLSIDDVEVREGLDAVFTVTLSSASDSTVTVDYATVDGTAVAPGDYGSVSGTLSFLPGQTSRTITVQVNGDSEPEDTEGFTVVLSNPAYATISDDSGAATVINNALPVLGALVVWPDTVNRVETMGVQTQGVSDGDGQIVRQEIYVDVDENGVIEPGVDELLFAKDGNFSTAMWSGAAMTWGLSVGSYRLLARAEDNYGTWSEAAAATLNVADYVVRDRRTEQFTDDDGTLVTITLKGPGAAGIWLGGDGYIERIEASGTTDASSLTIKTDRGGDGKTFVDEFTVAGSLRTLSAKTTDLRGNLGITGNLASLWLGDVSSGGEMSIHTDGGIPTPLTLRLKARFGQVADCTLDTGGIGISSLTASRWSGEGLARGSIVAAWIGGVKITAGDFAADLELGHDAKGVSLGKLSAVGAVRSDMTLSGAAGSLSATGWESGSLNASSLKGLKIKQDIGDLDVDILGAVGSISARRWVSGSLEADSLRTLKMTGLREDLSHGIVGIPGDLGATMTLRGENVPAGRKTLNSAKIAGTLTAPATIHGDVGSMTLSLASDLVIDGSAGSIKVAQPLASVPPSGGSVGMVDVGGSAKVVGLNGTFAMTDGALYVNDEL